MRNRQYEPSNKVAEVRVMQGTVGLYGDLQGIAGKMWQEIEGLDLPALEGPHTAGIDPRGGNS